MSAAGVANSHSEWLLDVTITVELLLHCQMTCPWSPSAGANGFQWHEFMSVAKTHAAGIMLRQIIMCQLESIMQLVYASSVCMCVWEEKKICSYARVQDLAETGAMHCGVSGG